MKLSTTIKTAMDDDVSKAYEYYFLSEIYNKSNSKYLTDSKYGFWSNDIEYDLDNPSKIKKHGSLEALKKFSETDATVVTTHDFIDQRKQHSQSIENLDEYWKCIENNLITMDVYIAVANIASESFAQKSSGEVCVSVKGASFDSLFRRTELFALMENDNVTHFINLSMDNVNGIKYEKKEAFHVLHDQWLDLRIEKYNLSNQMGEKGEIHETATKNLAKEIALAQQRLEERCFFPSVYSARKLKDDINKYTEKDQERERDRLAKVEQLLISNPKLAEEVNKIKRGGLGPIGPQFIINSLHSSHKNSLDSSQKNSLDSLQEGAVEELKKLDRGFAKLQELISNVKNTPGPGQSPSINHGSPSKQTISK